MNVQIKDIRQILECFWIRGQNQLHERQRERERENPVEWIEKIIDPR